MMLPAWLQQDEPEDKSALKTTFSRSSMLRRKSTRGDIFAQFDAPEDEAAVLPDEDDFVMGQLKADRYRQFGLVCGREKPAAAEDVPDWLQSLDNVPEPEAEEEMPAASLDEEAAVPAEDSFLADLFAEVEREGDDPFAARAPVDFSSPQSLGSARFAGH